jgi:general stress protein 26
VWHDGKFWLTASGQRKRIAALRRDGRASVCINGTGTSEGGRTVTYAGRCVVRDDRPCLEWFYKALATKLMGDTPAARGFEKFLDSPRRVVLELTPERRIGFDGRKMMGSTMPALIKLGSEE